MKRRNILLGGTALISVPAIGEFSLPAQAADASRLSGDLTPFGSERAGNASGSIPAWTGGATQPPAGWDPNSPPPNLFDDERPVFTVTAANMAQYADMLTDGQKQMFKQYGAVGYKINVYPTHRTVAMPQWVYNNTVQNLTNAQPVSEGLVAGIQGVAGGTPFPIIDPNEPDAGLKVMWNLQTRWNPLYSHFNNCNGVVGNGQDDITNITVYYSRFSYYDPTLTAATQTRYFLSALLAYTGPPNQAGGKLLVFYTLNPLVVANVAYEYLVGEGRVRQSPSAQYDTPDPAVGDAANYDESYCFTGAMDRYTWKLVGKKEMIVPYNGNAQFLASHSAVNTQHFQNPEYIRHEIHRCWIVEAHLAPGARMSSPLRRMYVDEDSWAALLSDSYDDQGNYWKMGINYSICMPSLPGLMTNVAFTTYNLQEGEYGYSMPSFNDRYPLGGHMDFTPLPAAMFTVQSLANSGGL
jgi:hypothetical protein